jgi:hypothetical protein
MGPETRGMRRSASLVYQDAGTPQRQKPDDDVSTNRIVGLTVNIRERTQLTTYRFFIGVAALLPLRCRLSK